MRASTLLLPFYLTSRPRVGREIASPTDSILTGQDSFSEYSDKIGREVTVQCHQCAADLYSAQQTLEDYSMWMSECEVLVC